MLLRLFKEVPEFAVSFTMFGGMIITRNETIDVRHKSMNQIGAMLVSDIKTKIATPEVLQTWAYEHADATIADVDALQAKQVECVYCYRFLLGGGTGWVSKADFLKLAKIGTQFLIHCVKEFTVTEISSNTKRFTVVDTFGRQFTLVDLDRYPFLVLMLPIV